ncbi:matrix metalloproteinase-18-like [Anneissia japonica]|uniref:matrix metalloproteinase-18-like n=1 Tax=Anneissia japonica TaxID=1529436 RepID=UPI0014256B1F|nr:matrix metalloproteinase-18-like [Anneissia japonica]
MHSIRLCGWLVFNFLYFSLSVAELTDDQAETTVEYLKRYGYIDRVSKRGGNEFSSKELSEALSKLQKYAGLTDVTGNLTPETLKLMRTSRCGVLDPIDDSTGELEHRRAKRYELIGSRWRHNDVTYRILNYSPDLPNKTIDKVIKKAFNMWSAVSPLTFTRLYSDDADIRIRFGTYSHGDSWAFDGEGGTLAHAFAPGSNKHGINGDLHFDDSETFTHRSHKGTNLLFTAVHELGHSLGLEHSDVRGSVMYPWYYGYRKNLALQPDDIAGIQAIYGSKESPKTVAPPTTETPEYWTPPPTWSDEDAANFPWPNDPKCDITFNGIIKLRSQIYAFEGNSFWRWQSHEGGRYSILISNMAATRFLRGLPDNVDAAYFNTHTAIVRVFKDEEYWDYSIDDPTSSNPQKITNLSKKLPAKIDAAVFSDRDDKTFMFRGKNVWRYDEGTKQVDGGYPKPIAVEFPGIGERVDAAFRGENDESIYFLTDRVLRQVDISRHLLMAEPVFFAEKFLGCERS